MMKKPKAPCSPDCSKRAAECRKTCPEWPPYEEAHNKWLKEQEQERKKKTELDEFKSYSIGARKHRRTI